MAKFSFLAPRQMGCTPFKALTFFPHLPTSLHSRIQSRGKLKSEKDRECGIDRRSLRSVGGDSPWLTLGRIELIKLDQIIGFQGMHVAG